MLTRTVYVQYEEAGLTPSWRRSRRVCPTASALTAVSHRNRRVCRAAPRRTPTIYATTMSMNTYSPKRMDTHTYTIAVYKRDANYIFYDHGNKNLQHESCVEQCGEATRQWKFLTAARVRRIWKNSVKSISNKIEAYTKRNSKRMVRMDSPCRGASFSCRTYVSTIHGGGTIKGLWGSCLEEEEKRKLNEDEGKQV
jgi:hypothetical protein